MKLPKELDAFIQEGRGEFHCEDGTWYLALIPAEKSEFSKELPKGAMMIAENGSGDCLFLKGNAMGKSKVFVYWHEEQRAEVFAPTLRELIEGSAEPKEEKVQPAAKGKKMSVKELESASGNPRRLYEKLQALKAGAVGVEALPLLRRALIGDDVQVAIEAAECIAKLGARAREAADGGPEGLETDLFVTGSKVWSYSLYCNCYSACLDALRKIEADEDLILEYVAHNIGAENPDDLLESLRALQAIGTKEAKRFMERAVRFWEPVLDVRSRKEVEQIRKMRPGGERKQR
jgi:hypothetical protein